MQKESRERAWKATSKTRMKPINDNTTQDADIVNLNQNNNFVPIEEIEEEEFVPLTEEEKREVRKKLFILLLAIVIALIIMIIMLIFDPFSGKKDDSKEKDKEKPIVEEKEDEEDTTLQTMKDGTINIDNLELTNLIQIIKFNSEEQLFNDIPTLYTKVPVTTTELNNNQKILLTTKSKEFNDLFKTKITNNYICGSELKITLAELNDISKKVINTEITAPTSFYFSYYQDNVHLNTILFKKQNDYYVGECVTKFPQPKTVVQQSVVKATKENNKVKIDLKIVFANQNGVYKEPSFKTLITNDKDINLEEYINKGNTYQYTFDVSSDNYYLEGISLLK